MHPTWRLWSTWTLATASLVSACTGTAVSFGAQRLSISPVSAGRVMIGGGPGAVVGTGVTTLTLTVARGPAPTVTWRVRHVGWDHIPIISTWAPVAPDGSFPSTAIGTDDRPVRPGDELVITPQAGMAQAGRSLSIPLN